MALNLAEVCDNPSGRSLAFRLCGSKSQLPVNQTSSSRHELRSIFLVSPKDMDSIEGLIGAIEQPRTKADVYVHPRYGPIIHKIDCNLHVHSCWEGGCGRGACCTTAEKRSLPVKPLLQALRQPSKHRMFQSL